MPSVNAAMQAKASRSLACAAEQQGAEHGDGFGRHGEQEPGAVDAGAAGRAWPSRMTTAISVV